MFNLVMKDSDMTNRRGGTVVQSLQENNLELT